MKTKALYLLVLLALVTACGSDDGEDATIGMLGTIEVDGQTLDVNSAFLADFGPQMPLDEASHYNYDFSLTDGDISASNVQPGQDFEATYLLFAELFSPGTNNFQDGTFNFVNAVGLTQSDINDEFIFMTAEFFFDANGDGILDDLDPGDPVVAGTIMAEGSGNSYTLTYDVELASGKTINTSFSGRFIIF